MRNIFRISISILWMACAVVHATAECSLADFDKGPPISARDTTPPTTESKFEWGSDVDRWGTEARAWHYIRNLNNKNLALDWQKTRFVIPFYNPLIPGDTICKYDYGSLESFKLDNDAPIRVSNDGLKSAQAYVQVAPAKQSSMTGGELRRDFRGPAGEIADAFVRIFFRYSAAEKLLQVELRSSSGGIQLGIGPDRLNLPPEAFASKLSSANIELQFRGPLQKVVPISEARAIGADPADNIFIFRVNGERTLTFENVSPDPSGVAPMLLISPDNKMLGLTSIRLDQLNTAK